QGKTLPDKPVVLTFDDGYEDNYTNAFPLLKKYSMTAYFFVLTDVTTEGRTGYMTWPQLAEMSAAGEHIGAHGRNHLQAFRGKSRDFLNWHALGTMEAIQQHLGYHPRWVAYPTGAYDDLTMEVFHSAGFVGGLSTEPGATHRPDTLFHLSRVRVHGNYSAEELGRVLKAS
ncbi:MAG TPA: polysaccharide deacetylase family protein, partial [Anaerolineae bacterium]